MGHFEGSVPKAAFLVAGVTLLMGAVGYSRTTFQTLWVLPNLMLFPLSVLAIWFCDHVLHLK